MVHSLTGPISPRVYKLLKTTDLENVTNATVTQAGGGIDLSLPLAKRFVEVHGGEISVSNKADTGTVVAIDLPRRLLLH